MLEASLIAQQSVRNLNVAIIALQMDNSWRAWLCCQVVLVVIQH